MLIPNSVLVGRTTATVRGTNLYTILVPLSTEINISCSSSKFNKYILGNYEALGSYYSKGRKVFSYIICYPITFEPV